jgi:hypothetical protein
MVTYFDQSLVIFRTLHTNYLELQIHSLVLSPIVGVRGPVMPALTVPLQEQTDIITVGLLYIDTEMITVKDTDDTSGCLQKYTA